MIGTFEPRVFDVGTIAQAKRIILTPEGSTTEERWAKETPYLADLIVQHLTLRPDSVLLDYGCGIGRLAKELIARKKCRVIGVDMSASMRALSVAYVESDSFFACSPAMLDTLIARKLVVDAAIAVWVLQHCKDPSADISRIGRCLPTSGELFVVNNIRRAVPMMQRTLGPSAAKLQGRWVDDGIDIKALLSDRFACLQEGRFAPDRMAADLVGATYWAKFKIKEERNHIAAKGEMA